MKGKFLLTSALGLTLLLSGNDYNQAHETTGGQEHKKITVPNNVSVPEVDLVVYPDNVKGWNLEIKLANFEFEPSKINQDSNINKGHAHLYINGKKVTRIYGNWYYLEALEPGKNEIQITLNTNKHEDLIYNGQVIQDTEIIEVK